MAEIAARYADAEQKQLDGISIDYDDWHFNVRPSNTEPLLRLCLESLVSPRGHGAPPRRGARADPVVKRRLASPHREAGARPSKSHWSAPPQEGIHRLAIPTPFLVGRVNAYLIEDSPLTLIDSGPNSGKALDELEQALAARGHAVEDIELLVVSHQHIDHFGLASILARRSGAEVAALDKLAPYLARFGHEAELDDRFAEQMMLRHGIPAEVVTALRAVSASFRAWGAAVEVTRPLRDGERAAAARPHAAGAPPARAQPLGHGVPGRGSARSCSPPTT